MKTLIFKLIAICILYQANAQTCNKPNTVCKKIQECPKLHSLLKPSMTQEDRQTLTAARCGQEGFSPKVCCPEPVPVCQTPEGKEGECKSIYDCPHILEKLQTKIPEKINYVRRSTCRGSAQYSVCCGPNLDIPEAPTCPLTELPVNPDTECCGRDSGIDKIYGGEEAQIDQYPWMALLEYQDRFGAARLLCGGSLISSRFVMTAAHCVVGPVQNVGELKAVRLGDHDKKTDPDCVPIAGGGTACNDKVVKIPVQRIIAHEEYNPFHRLKRHDIALLRLERLAPYTSFIRPICMPTMDYTQTLDETHILYVAGWGAVSETRSSDVKLFVDVPFVSKEDCQPAYCNSKRNVTLWKGQICAGGEAGKDSCKGDSGGPLMFDTGENIQLLGVVSFGPTPCGREDIPAVYTNVYHYLPWINEKMKQ